MKATIKLHHNARDITGQRFGRLIALRPVGRTRPRQSVIWLCKCDCGLEAEAVTSDLTTGHITSCGCRRAEILASITPRSVKHGKASTPEYRSWECMKARCLNPNTEGFERYGRRGIKVCDRWLDSFENFFADMGPKPTKRHTIDREDVDGNYEPSNCRWATHSEQCCNKSDNRLLTLNGETLPLIEWSRRFGVASHVIAQRVGRGWSLQRALTAPIDVKRASDRLLRHNGKTLNVSAWARELGISRDSIRGRLRLGWSVADALTKDTNKKRRAVSRQL